MTFGKNQNAGPYANDGYINDPHSSHLNFLKDEEVLYIGDKKFKNKNNIPNGAIGIVLNKDDSKGLKSSRSQIKVDFGEHGVRYVHKNLLQFPSDYSQCLETQLTKGQRFPKKMTDEQKEQREAKLQAKKDARYAVILSNRENNKKFRKWRKDFLDQKKLELTTEIETALQSVEHKKDRESRKEAIKKLNELEEKWTKDSILDMKNKYIEEYVESERIAAKERAAKQKAENPDSDNQVSDLNKDEIYRSIGENLFKQQYKDILNTQKNKDDRQMRLLKTTIQSLNEKIKGKMSELNEIRDIVESDKRDFFRKECSSPYYYNQMLHEKWNEFQGEEPVPQAEEKEEEKKNKKRYKKKSTPDYELLRWGLYPNQMVF